MKAGPVLGGSCAGVNRTRSSSADPAERSDSFQALTRFGNGWLSMGTVTFASNPRSFLSFLVKAGFNLSPPGFVEFRASAGNPGRG